MIRISNAIGIVFFVLLFWACSKDKDPQPEKYFILNVDILYNSTDFIENGNWIIIHDENGVVWDYSTYVAGQQIFFDSIAVPEKLGITFLEVTPDKLPIAKMTTYLNINHGEEWTIGPSTYVNPGQHLGSISVNVADNNLGSALNSQFTTSNRNGIGQYQAFSYADIITSNNKDYLLFVTDKDSKPLYKIFNDVVPGTYSLTLADFNFFDQEINLTFPETNLFQFVARGYPQGYPFDPELGFVSSLYWDGYFTQIPRTSVKLGYLNEFASYYVSGLASYDNGNSLLDNSFRYEFYDMKPPGSITITDDFDAAVSNKTFAGYSVSGEGYSTISTTWGINGTVNGIQSQFIWSINSPKGDFKVMEAIPANIAQVFPFINFDNQVYISTVFSKGNRTYADEISQKYKGEAVKPFERFSKEIF